MDGYTACPSGSSQLSPEEHLAQGCANAQREAFENRAFRMPFADGGRMPRSAESDATQFKSLQNSAGAITDAHLGKNVADMVFHRAFRDPE